MRVACRLMTMIRVTPARAALLFGLLAAVCAAVLYVALHRFGGEGDTRSFVVSGGTARVVWKTIEYDNVRIDIPADWQRPRTGGCQFTENWTPPNSSACRLDEGVAFYRSASFDPASGAGVRRITEGPSNDTTWAGYVYAGELAVCAVDLHRVVVEDVLNSARVDHSAH